MDDQRNREGFSYWDASWDSEGIQSFSVHSTFVENAKWHYLCPRLKGYSGRSLEVGCGSGHLSALMAQAGFETVLLDYSPAAIGCAQKSFTALRARERKRYVLGNALALPIADGVIDVVLSCGTLEHFENPSVPIREMVRVLRKGGLFYSDICPRKFSLIGMLVFVYPQKSGWYEARLTKQDIVDLLHDAGCRDIQIISAGVLPPRNIPGKGRIRLIGTVEQFIIRHFESFWLSLDGTQWADWLGFYYFVTAQKK